MVAGGFFFRLSSRPWCRQGAIAAAAGNRAPSPRRASRPATGGRPGDPLVSPAAVAVPRLAHEPDAGGVGSVTIASMRRVPVGRASPRRSRLGEARRGRRRAPSLSTGGRERSEDSRPAIAPGYFRWIPPAADGIFALIPSGESLQQYSG